MQFRFAAEGRAICGATDWQSSAASDLWLYNLHYFDDLNAQGADSRAAWHGEWFQKWLRDNPPGIGKGWDPYPTSLRLVNWVRWALRKHSGADGLSNLALDSRAVVSLASQTRWLDRRFETHLLGNHLWSNAKALCFVGTFFESIEADRWRRRGLGVLHEELAEQVLADGGHFERSPMYHGLFLEDVLDLLQLAKLQPSLFSVSWVSALEESARKMLHWMHVMVHRDDDIAFFNDATLGICPSLSVLRNYAATLDSDLVVSRDDLSGITHLPASGFVRLQNSQTVVLADVGSVGPDHLPGHAHAGTLSFELSLRRGRLVVNSGVSIYGTGPERQRQRGTAAHSALVIDGENSSEVWAGFRVARRARVVESGFGEGENELRFWATHDGYRRLPGSPVHRRTWTLDSSGLLVEDQITGVGRHALQIVFHLAPGWAAASEGDRWIRIRRLDSPPELSTADAQEILFHFESPFEASIEPSTWHPGFGRTEPSQSISLRAMLELPATHMTRIEWHSVK